MGPSHAPGIERLGLRYERPAVHVREYLTIVKSLVDEQKAVFQGEFFNVDAAFQMPWAKPFPVLISALAPAMLKTAGELADGTVTWMVGLKTLTTHVIPRITKAAAEAGRPAPRICVGLPVAVCDDEKEGRRTAAERLAFYANLPNYKRVVDIEGGDPGDVVVCGNEAAVERQLREFAAAGAYEFNAAPLAVGENTRASVQRTRELLNSLTGKL
jgi:F420-dependent oxidoreductase-like protein